MSQSSLNVIDEIGNHIALKDNAMAELWRLKYASLQQQCAQEQIRFIVRTLRPVFLNMESANANARAVFNEDYFSEEWLKQFKHHVVPLIILHGIA